MLLFQCGASHCELSSHITFHLHLHAINGMISISLSPLVGGYFSPATTVAGQHCTPLLGISFRSTIVCDSSQLFVKPIHCAWNNNSNNNNDNNNNNNIVGKKNAIRPFISARPHPSSRPSQRLSSLSSSQSPSSLLSSYLYNLLLSSHSPLCNHSSVFSSCSSQSRIRLVSPFILPQFSFISGPPPGAASAFSSHQNVQQRNRV